MAITLKKLGDIASGVARQVNVIDNNQTYKQKAPTQSKSAFQQLGQLGGQTARAVVGNTARFVNTAAAQVPQVVDTVRMQVAARTNNPGAFADAFADSRRDLQRFKSGGGLLDRGTLYNADEAQRGALTTGLRRIGGGTLGTASEVLPFARGASLLRAGGGLGTNVVRGGVEGALYGATGGVASQLVEGDGFNPKEVLKSAGVGAGLGALGPIVGKAVRLASGKAVTPDKELRMSKAAPEMADGVSQADLKDIIATHRQRFDDSNVGIGAIDDPNVNGKYQPALDQVTIAPGKNRPNFAETLNHEHIHKSIGQFLSDTEIGSLYKDVVAVRGGKKALQNKYQADGYRKADWRTAAEEEISNLFTDFLKSGVVNVNGANVGTRLASWAAEKGLPQSIVDILYKLGVKLRQYYAPRHDVAASNLASFYKKVDSGGFKGAPRTPRKVAVPFKETVRLGAAKHLMSPKYGAVGVDAANKLLGVKLSRSSTVDVPGYLKQLDKEQTLARNAGIGAKVRRAVKTAKTKFVDSNAPIEDVVRQAVKDGAKIEPKYNITYAIDRAIQSDRIAGQYIKDNGLDKIIRQVPDTKAFGQYLIAKRSQAVGARGIETGRDRIKDRQLVEALASQYEPHAQALSKYNSGLLDKAADYGLISKETAEKLKRDSPEYVPMERIFSPDEQILQQGGSGSGKVSISTNKLQQRLRGSGRVVDDPLNGILKNTQQIIEQGERANAGRILASYRELPGNPFEITPLRTAEKVNLRYANYKKLAESRPIKQALAKEVSRASKEIKDLAKRNAGLGKDVLKRIQDSKGRVRDQAMRLANGTRSLPTKSERVAKIPDSSDIQEAFEQYLDGNPKLVREMYEFIGNKSTIARTQKHLDAIASQFQAIKKQRSDLFNEARANSDALTRGKATFSTFRDGVKEIYETTPEVAAAAKSLNKEQLNLLGKILSYPTRVLRLGATGGNVAFAAANVTRDLLTAIVNSKHPIRSSVLNPSVFLDALKAATNHGSAQYGELLREGAAGTSFDIARDAPVQNVARVRAQRNVGTKALYTVRHPGELIRAVENTIGRSEELSRALQYYGNKQAFLKEGDTLSNARLRAAGEARNNTVNFGRAGDYGRVLNTVLPYLNAGIQGSRTFVRNLRDRPVQTATKVALTAFLPVAATTAWNLSDPDRKKAYDNISDYEKQTNIIIVPSNPKQDKSGKWNVIKIPMSQEVASLADAVRQGIESWKGDRNINFGRVLGDLVGAGTSLQTDSPRQLVGQFTPQALKPGVESLTNQNLYFGDQIVPDAMKNLAPEDQVNKNTSGTAKVVGGLTGQSPLKVDNAIRTATGGLGQQLVRASDEVLARTGKIDRSEVKGQNPVKAIVGRFNAAQGQAPGSLYFSTLEEETKKQHLAGRDYSLLNALKSKEVDGDGQPLPQNEKDALSSASIRANNPRVLAVEAAAAKKLAKTTGQSLDPIYNLTPDQQQTYYRIQASPYKGDDYNQLTDKSKEWLPTFQDKRSAFFDNLKKSDTTGVTPSARVKYPTFSDGVQGKLDQYFELTDPAERAAFLGTNGDVKKAFDDINQYTNARRVAQGYDPFGAYPEPSPEVSQATSAYFGLDKAQRKGWIKANPDLYAKIQQSLADSAAWQLANNAGKAKFEGEELNQKALKSTYSLGQYDIFKDPDTGVYSIDPTKAYLANYQARYGNRGGSGSSGVSTGGRVSFKSGSSRLKTPKVKVSTGKRGRKVSARGTRATVARGRPKVSLKRSLV